MRKKIIISVLVALAIIVPLSFMVVRHREAEFIRAIEELLYRERIVSFAVAMRFEPFTTTSINYTEVLLVHTEEEAEALDLPEYVLVMWPTVSTFARLIEINNVVIINEIDLSEFGLMYPITIDDVIYNRELVHDLYGRGFSNNDRARVARYAPAHIRAIEEAAREENQE